MSDREKASTTHTPGPWRALPNGDVELSNGERVMVPGRFAAQIEANAALIAAAPELLAALDGCLDALKLARLGATPGMAEIDGALAAIAKARGEA